jgi:probable phosphoglycerate mutase
MAEGPRFEVVLIAAGPTAWDLAGRLAGKTDLPLSAEGVQAAASAANRLADLHPAALLCGPDEAASAFGAQLGRGLSLKPKVLGGLAAMDLGLWEGITKAQLIERCPRVCKSMQSDPESVVPPSGESWADVRTRALSAFFGGIPRKGGPIVIVARPSVIWVLRAALDELSGRTPVQRDCSACPAWGEPERLVFEPSPAVAGDRSGWLGLAGVGLGVLGLAAGPWPHRG